MGISPFIKGEWRPSMVQSEKRMSLAMKKESRSVRVLACATLALGCLFNFDLGLVLPAQAQYTTGSSANYGTAPVVTLPNYWGDARVNNAAYGDYRNPYTGGAVYDNGTVNTKGSLPSNFGSTYQNTATSSSSGFNSMGLVMGAGMLGGSALLMNASRLATLRAGGHPMAGGNSQKAYHEAMVKAERRRKEQEDKINRELQAAHEDNMRKRGQFKRPAESESVRGEAENMAARPANGQSFERPGISEAGLASDKFQKQEEIPGDSAQALSF